LAFPKEAPLRAFLRHRSTPLFGQPASVPLSPYTGGQSKRSAPLMASETSQASLPPFPAAQALADDLVRIITLSIA